MWGLGVGRIGEDEKTRPTRVQEHVDKLMDLASICYIIQAYTVQTTRRKLGEGAEGGGGEETTHVHIRPG